MKTGLIWVLRLVAAGILLQTLYFKFTAAPESVYIFSTLGVEPWGRILSGVVELMASVLLLVPGMQIFGSFIALGVMAGAMGSHLGVLGISVQNDGGLLFALAVVVFACSLAILALEREQVFKILARFRA